MAVTPRALFKTGPKEDPTGLQESGIPLEEALVWNAVGIVRYKYDRRFEDKRVPLGMTGQEDNVHTAASGSPLPSLAVRLTAWTWYH